MKYPHICIKFDLIKYIYYLYKIGYYMKQILKFINEKKNDKSSFKFHFYFFFGVNKTKLLLKG